MEQQSSRWIAAFINGLIDEMISVGRNEDAEKLEQAFAIINSFFRRVRVPVSTGTTEGGARVEVIDCPTEPAGNSAVYIACPAGAMMTNLKRRQPKSSTNETSYNSESNERGKSNDAAPVAVNDSLQSGE